MKTLRQAYDQYLSLYGPLVTRASVDDALLRGAFAAGVVHGLALAKPSAPATLAALEQMNAEAAELWEP